MAKNNLSPSLRRLPERKTAFITTSSEPVAGLYTPLDVPDLDYLEDLGHKARQSEVLLPVETALDDIPALAVTGEEAFKLKQGRPVVLLPRQVETLRPLLKPRPVAGQDASRAVSATFEDRIVALCEMRAGRLNPTRVFHLDLD